MQAPPQGHPQNADKPQDGEGRSRPWAGIQTQAQHLFPHPGHRLWESGVPLETLAVFPAVWIITAGSTLIAQQ